jgi:hypothetical protein
MNKIVISPNEYVEKNCSDCSCKRGCDLYNFMLHMHKSLTNIEMNGNSEDCSFKNIRGVNMEKIEK